MPAADTTHPTRPTLWITVFVPLLVLLATGHLGAQVVEIPTTPLEQPSATVPPSPPGQSPIADPSEPVEGPPPTATSPAAPPAPVDQPPIGLPTQDTAPGLLPPAPPAVTRAAFGAVAGGFASATNMIGDTTGGSCGVLEFDGALQVASVAHPTFACSRVNISENNSPLVRDRIYTSYRHFQGASNISVFPSSPNGGTALLNIDRFTLGMEKKIGRWSSLELRVPVNIQMSSNLFFSQTTALIPGGPPEVSIPLDDYETRFGNIALITKHLLWSCGGWALSGGLAMNFPTSPDVRLMGEIDDENFIIEDPNGNPIGNADVEFFFDALIKNELFTLSPYTAFLFSPGDKWFVQGFAQLDFPVSPLFGTIRGQLRSPILLPEFSDQGDIEVQQLARFSLGATRLLYRCDRARYLKQIAVTGELHYTTTIEDAQIAEVEVLPSIGIVPETTVQVGNISNRNDILNIVAGTHARIAKTTFTIGLALPLRDGDDKGFEYELTAMVNRQF